MNGLAVLAPLAEQVAGWSPLWMLGLALLLRPLWILLMCGVLKVAGVRRKDRAAWALRQADRRRWLDAPALVRRGPPPENPQQP